MRSYRTAKPWGEWTDRERRFFREWKSRWDSPRDWNEAAYHDGTSTLLEWVHWLTLICNMDLVVECLDAFCEAAGKTGPKLWQVKQLYNRRRSANQGATINTPPPDRSEPPASDAEAEEIIRRGLAAIAAIPTPAKKTGRGVS